MKQLLLIPILLYSSLWAAIDFDQMVSDLELVQWIDHVLVAPLPIQYNTLLLTGYFITPSARMSKAGVLGTGYSFLPPYRHYNLLAQPFSHLEFSLNWRIFTGIEDLKLSPHGFGSFADRGANVKLALLTPEENEYSLPGFAIGIEDFMGSKRFTNVFVVATQVWKSARIENSLGWGIGRYSGPSKGFFGALSWYPFFQKKRPFLEGFSATVEYDPIDYTKEKKEPHPNARQTNFPINGGLQYNYNNLLRLSCFLWRGKEISTSISASYNWGKSHGFFPKIHDPNPTSFYQRRNLEEEIMQAFKEQGLILTRLSLCNDMMMLTVKNNKWLRESDLRRHLAYLLVDFPYRDVKRFIVLLESCNLKCQSYHFHRDWVENYCKGKMSAFEFDLLSKRKEPLAIPRNSEVFFQKDCYKPKIRIRPRFENFFGSARGKFKYDVGLQFEAEGTLPYHLYYEAKCSITAFSTLNDVGDIDFYHPSQLPNVATDYINYRNRGNFVTDRLYLQAARALPASFFGRVAAGYFQVNYGGIAGELLWYPASSSLALGIEGALVKKRCYHGLGFQPNLRQLEGFTPTYHPYTLLNQYFFDIYLDFPGSSFFTKISMGGFLAHDQGIRMEATRYFQNGLRLTAWFSLTDAKDMMHGAAYFDRGVAIEIPLELFFTKSCRRVLSYGMGAWLRDAGYRTRTGFSLFDILNQERRY